MHLLHTLLTYMVVIFIRRNLAHQQPTLILLELYTVLGGYTQSPNQVYAQTPIQGYTQSQTQGFNQSSVQGYSQQPNQGSPFSYAYPPNYSFQGYQGVKNAPGTPTQSSGAPGMYPASFQGGYYIAASTGKHFLTKRKMLFKGRILRLYMGV